MERLIKMAVIFGVIFSIIGFSLACITPPVTTNLGNSSSSLSAIESEATTTAIKAWTDLLDTQQGLPDSNIYLQTTVSDSKLSEDLINGSGVGVGWAYWDPGQANVGDVQIKDFKSGVSSTSLSSADEANGVTWRGTVYFSFIERYRAVVYKPIPVDTANVPSTPADTQTFSEWENVSTLASFGSGGISVDLVKQNGEWTSTVNDKFLIPNSK